MTSSTSTSNFYPRPPRGGRQHTGAYRNDPRQISIHALREEGDRFSKYLWGCCVEFLSTPSARRATRVRRNRPQDARISIHALREEGDRRAANELLKRLNFYPRPPRGGRPKDNEAAIAAIKFLSTPSARRAPSAVQEFVIGRENFYPRPPRGGRPWSLRFPPVLLRDFYPRPPRGGRQEPVEVPDISKIFLSTPSARRATTGLSGRCTAGCEFLSTPSARRATAKTETKSLFSNKLYNILHEFRRALIYNGSKSYPNHAK